MPNPATYEDVEARWRPLSATDPDERTVATTLLEDAWVMLKQQATRRGIDDLEAQIAADADLSAGVVRLLATAVIRVLRNPDGVRSEQTDDYAWTRDSGSNAGELYLDDTDLDALFPGAAEGGRAFMIDPLADYATRWDEA